MSIEEYLKLMQFPAEWQELEMVPSDEYMESLIASYQPGMENASEHDRNGAFHWWLRRDPSEQQLLNLAKLASVDPDQLMANDVRRYIRKATNYSGAVEAVLRNAI